MAESQRRGKVSGSPGGTPPPRRGKKRRGKSPARRILPFVAAVSVLGLAVWGLTALLGSATADANRSSGKESLPAQSADGGSSAAPEPGASSASETGALPTSETASSVDGHYVQPAGAAWNLKLVNQWNVLPEEYEKSLEVYAGSNQFDSRAMDSLRALVKAGAAYNIRAVSTYRSVEKQKYLYEKEIQSEVAKGHDRAEAEKIAAASVAPPGTSEHNLGLAVDFLFEDYNYLTEKYKDTPAYTWMMAHCAEYGFILRFPENKQDITGVTFEPWHYRYVGVDAAREIMRRGVTLEEYLQEKGL